MVVFAHAPISDDPDERRHVLPAELVVVRAPRKFHYRGLVFPVDTIGVEWSFFQHVDDADDTVDTHTKGNLDRIRILTGKKNSRGVYQGRLVTMAEKEEGYKPIAMEVKIERLSEVASWDGGMEFLRGDN
jgi:hypothetical protein